jgi:hypothetical protein
MPRTGKDGPVLPLKPEVRACGVKRNIQDVAEPWRPFADKEHGPLNAPIL